MTNLELINDLMSKLADCQAECLEQARLNGMGGSREAKLLAQVSELERDIARWKASTIFIPLGDGSYNAGVSDDVAEEFRHLREELAAKSTELTEAREWLEFTQHVYGDERDEALTDDARQLKIKALILRDLANARQEADEAKTAMLSLKVTEGLKVADYADANKALKAEVRGLKALLREAAERIMLDIEYVTLDGDRDQTGRDLVKRLDQASYSPNPGRTVGKSRGLSEWPENWLSVMVRYSQQVADLEAALKACQERP